MEGNNLRGDFRRIVIEGVSVRVERIGDSGSDISHVEEKSTTVIACCRFGPAPLQALLPYPPLLVRGLLGSRQSGSQPASQLDGQAAS